jgi:hypothetical protein
MEKYSLNVHTGAAGIRMRVRIDEDFEENSLGNVCFYGRNVKYDKSNAGSMKTAIARLKWKLRSFDKASFVISDTKS